MDRLIKVYDRNHPNGEYITYESNLPHGLKYEVIEEVPKELPKQPKPQPKAK